MKLKIKFDEIKDTIEQASHENHYFIDKKINQIVFINEYGSQEEPESRNNDTFISIPARIPMDDINIMKLFMYRLSDFNLAMEFGDALSKRNPITKFMELLSKHPEFKEKWSEHRNNEIANEAMNWLYENNIELEDMSFMPKINIKEVKSDEVKLPEEFDTFGPIACMNCNNEEGIRTRYFELDVPCENKLIEKEIKRLMKDRYGIEDYGCISGGDKEILTYSVCPKCKSSDIFEDF